MADCSGSFQIIPRSAMIFGLLAIVLDVLVWNTAGVSALIFLALPFLLLRGLWAWKDRALLKRRFAGIGVLLIAIIVVFGALRINAAITRNRAAEIIAACERFKKGQGRYPEHLHELVPDFMKKIPRTSYAVLAGEFRYLVKEEQHLLFYTAVPPYGRAHYNFETQKWSFSD